MKSFIFSTFLLISTTMAAENENLKAVSRGNNILTNKLYTQLAKEDGNVFFSPISAYTALSLLYQGAEGNTETSMRDALNLLGKSNSAEGFESVMSSLNNVPDVTLNIANKVYVKDGYTMKDSFKSIATKSFFSEGENLNFAQSAAAAKTINGWVEQKTNNKIKDLISPDSLDAMTRMVLVNAIYFKGDWAEKFDASRTTKEPFYVSETQEVECDMMHKTHKYNYKEDQNLDAKILQIPYKNKDLSLVIVLPNKKNGIKELEQKLADYDLNQLTDRMMNVEVILSLPKFKIETEMDLKNPLKEIGLGDIFSDNANFSGLLNSPEPLAVSKVIQKAFIEVNEEGSEAAAATGVMMTARCCMVIMQKKTFKADHPFMFFLSHNDSPLFVGKLSQTK